MRCLHAHMRHASRACTLPRHQCGLHTAAVAGVSKPGAVYGALRRTRAAPTGEGSRSVQQQSSPPSAQARGPARPVPDAPSPAAAGRSARGSHCPPPIPSPPCAPVGRHCVQRRGDAGRAQGNTRGGAAGRREREAARGKRTR